MAKLFCQQDSIKTAYWDRLLLDILQHPNQARYAGQRIFVVNIDDYAYLVPCVEGAGEVFLNTIIPSRKATNIYLRRRREDGEARS